MTEEPLRVSALQLATDKQLIDELCARTSGDSERVFIGMFVRPSEANPGTVDGWTITRANNPLHLRGAMHRLLVTMGVNEHVANAVLPTYQIDNPELRIHHTQLLTLLGILGQLQLQGRQALLPATPLSEEMIQRFAADAKLTIKPATNLAVFVDAEGRIRLTVQPTQGLLITETPIPPTT